MDKKLILICILILTNGCAYNSILLEARFRTSILPIDLRGKVHIQDRTSVDAERNEASRRQQILDAILDLKKVKSNHEENNSTD